LPLSVYERLRRLPPVLASSQLCIMKLAENRPSGRTLSLLGQINEKIKNVRSETKGMSILIRLRIVPEDTRNESTHEEPRWARFVVGKCARAGTRH
jgi:hypothetical protein